LAIGNSSRFCTDDYRTNIESCCGKRTTQYTYLFVGGPWSEGLRRTPGIKYCIFPADAIVAIGRNRSDTPSHVDWKSVEPVRHVATHSDPHNSRSNINANHATLENNFNVDNAIRVNKYPTRPRQYSNWFQNCYVECWKSIAAVPSGDGPSCSLISFL